MEYIKLKYASRKLLRHMIVVHGVTEDIESIPMSYDDVVVGAAELELEGLLKVTRTDKIERLYVTDKGRRYCEFNPEVKNPPIYLKIINAALSIIGLGSVIGFAVVFVYHKILSL